MVKEKNNTITDDLNEIVLEKVSRTELFSSSALAEDENKCCCRKKQMILKKKQLLLKMKTVR